jgi:hypothetical protein
MHARIVAVTPGPTLVIACPHCDHLARQDTLASGNTLGARYWSDGAMFAPMLPEVPSVTRCDGCGGYYWIEDAREIGRLASPSAEAPREWRQAGVVRALAGDDWLDAVARGAAGTAERELYLRLHAWWAANDPYRVEGAAEADAPDFAPQVTENLLRLSALVPADDDENRLLKAEIARELGHFADAIALLSGPLDDDHHEPVAELLRSYARQEVRLVRELGRPIA